MDSTSEHLRHLGFSPFTKERGSEVFDGVTPSTWVKDLFRPNLTLIYDAHTNIFRGWDNHEKRWQFTGVLGIEKLAKLFDCPQPTAHFFDILLDYQEEKLITFPIT